MPSAAIILNLLGPGAVRPTPAPKPAPGGVEISFLGRLPEREWTWIEQEDAEARVCIPHVSAYVSVPTILYALSAPTVSFRIVGSEILALVETPDLPGGLLTPAVSVRVRIPGENEEAAVPEPERDPPYEIEPKEMVRRVYRGDPVEMTVDFHGPDPDEVYCIHLRPGDEQPVSDPGFGQPSSRIERLDQGIYRYVIRTRGFRDGLGWWHFWGVWESGAEKHVRGRFYVFGGPAQLL